MKTIKTIFTIASLFCCLLLLIGCTSQSLDNQIMINDKKYDVQFEKKSDTIENIEVQQNSKVTITLPRELPIYQWECSPKMYGMKLLEKKTTTIGEESKKEGVTNEADVFVFQVDNIQNSLLEFKKVNVNELENENTDYNAMDEVFKLAIEFTPLDY